MNDAVIEDLAETYREYLRNGDPKVAMEWVTTPDNVRLLAFSGYSSQYDTTAETMTLFGIPIREDSDAEGWALQPVAAA